MDILERADLEQLMHATGEHCISIYMPAHLPGAEKQQDPVRLKNLVRQANGELLEYGMRKPEAEQFLRPVEDLIEGREDFWRDQSGGLAVFLSSDFFKTFNLPVDLEEKVVVSNRFHFRPLLPLLNNEGKFYILAISINCVRLFEGTNHTIKSVELNGVPTSMQEALSMDEDPERFVGFHTRTTNPGTGGERGAIFYGHGDSPNDEKTNILRYFKYVDAGLSNLLPKNNTPMVLAGVEYLHPIYQQANTYPSLLEEGLTGNPDDLPEKDLHAAALELVQPQFERTQKLDLERFQQFHGQRNGLASADLEKVVRAAHFGQVDTLFVPTGVQRWGRFDPEQDKVTLDPEATPGSEDLLDYAALHTILNSGQVYAVRPEEMPAEGDLAAILRFTF